MVYDLLTRAVVPPLSLGERDRALAARRQKHSHYYGYPHCVPCAAARLLARDYGHRHGWHHSTGRPFGLGQLERGSNHMRAEDWRAEVFFITRPASFYRVDAQPVAIVAHPEYICDRELEQLRQLHPLLVAEVDASYPSWAGADKLLVITRNEARLAALEAEAERLRGIHGGALARWRDHLLGRQTMFVGRGYNRREAPGFGSLFHTDQTTKAATQ